MDSCDSIRLYSSCGIKLRTIKKLLSDEWVSTFYSYVFLYTTGNYSITSQHVTVGSTLSGVFFVCKNKII